MPKTYEEIKQKSLERYHENRYQINEKQNLKEQINIFNLKNLKVENFKPLSMNGNIDVLKKRIAKNISKVIISNENTEPQLVSKVQSDRQIQITEE